MIIQEQIVYHRERIGNPFCTEERRGQERNRKKYQGSSDASESCHLRVQIWVGDRDAQMGLGIEKQGALRSFVKFWKEIDFQRVFGQLE